MGFSNPFYFSVQVKITVKKLKLSAIQHRRSWNLRDPRTPSAQFLDLPLRNICVGDII